MPPTSLKVYADPVQSKFNPDNLHRHQDYAIVKKEAALEPDDCRTPTEITLCKYCVQEFDAVY